ncbi:unnamed protein product [Ectocarpus sp. CCAP 1310/34]|nr:unnamed protein product [Ectocarpus sp. CCAP 1310/34]
MTCNIRWWDSGPRKNTAGPGNKLSAQDALSHTGWSTSVAERLRAQTGGGGGGGGGRGGKGGRGGRGGGNGSQTGSDEAEAAAAMHALANSSSSTKDGGGGKKGVSDRKTAHLGSLGVFVTDERMLSPAEAAKIRKGNLGRALLSGGGDGETASKRGTNGGVHATARPAGGKKQRGGSGGGPKSSRGGPGADEDGHEEEEESDAEPAKRKTPGKPGRKPKKGKHSRSPLPEQAEKGEGLASVEAAVPEAGGDLSSPPAVSPFPNWAEDSYEMVGSRVRVYWDGDNEWYSGRIVRFKSTQREPYLVRCVLRTRRVPGGCWKA